MNTQGSRPCEGRGRDCSNASTKPKRPRTASNTRGHERRPGRFFPRNSQREPALPTSEFQTFGLQNGERINICHFWGTKSAVICCSSSGELTHPVNMWCPTRSPVWLVLSAFLRKWGRGHSLSFPWRYHLYRRSKILPRHAPGSAEATLAVSQAEGHLWRHLWDVGLSLSGSATTLRTGPHFRSQDPLGLGEGRSLRLFFLFCFYWDCTEVCGELDLFAGWGILHFQEPAFPILLAHSTFKNVCQIYISLVFLKKQFSNTP